MSSPEQLLWMDGEEEIWGARLTFVLVSPEHSSIKSKKYGAQGWIFVLVWPEHISVNEEEEIQGHKVGVLFPCHQNIFQSMKRKKYRGTRLDFCSLVVRTASHQLSFVSRFLASLLGDDESTDDAATAEFPNSHVCNGFQRTKWRPVIAS